MMRKMLDWLGFVDRTQIVEYPPDWHPEQPPTAPHAYDDEPELPCSSNPADWGWEPTNTVFEMNGIDVRWAPEGDDASITAIPVHNDTGGMAGLVLSSLPTSFPAVASLASLFEVAGQTRLPVVGPQDIDLALYHALSRGFSSRDERAFSSQHGLGEEGAHWSGRERRVEDHPTYVGRHRKER